MIKKITVDDKNYIDELIRYIRASDVDEYAQTGLEETVPDAVYRSVRESEECYVLLDKKERVIAIYGVSEPLLVGGRLVWALGTDLVDKNKKSFTKATKRALRQWVREYGLLWNTVAVSNSKTVKWLEWLGVEFGNETTINGNRFLPFCIYKDKGDD